MIAELGVGILAICMLGYAIHWQRERVRLAKVRWAKIHKKQLKRLKLLKKIEDGE